MIVYVYIRINCTKLCYMLLGCRVTLCLSGCFGIWRMCPFSHPFSHFEIQGFQNNHNQQVGRDPMTTIWSHTNRKLQSEATSGNMTFREAIYIMLTAFSGMLTLSLRFLHLLKVCLTDSFDWDINNLKYRKGIYACWYESGWTVLDLYFHQGRRLLHPWLH